MITVISGTNRPNSLTAAFSRQVVTELKSQTDEEIQLIDLAELPHDYFHSGMYDPEKTPTAFRALHEEKLLPAQKLVVLSPEYNGSFAGAIKVFFDAVSVHEYALNFKQKPILLIGVSTGRAGNLRGLDHLSHILEHMGGYLIGGKLPISLAGALVNDDREVVDSATKATIAKQITHLISI
ncbi:hypothetical protein CEQ90_03700 [Lewinellaceae bacterium SD302]|nr:hypothetical protein CEQ90_03700 [Lewinellaceae bacterium SD302]